MDKDRVLNLRKKIDLLIRELEQDSSIFELANAGVSYMNAEVFLEDLKILRETCDETLKGKRGDE